MSDVNDIGTIDKTDKIKTDRKKYKIYLGKKDKNKNLEIIKENISNKKPKTDFDGGWKKVLNLYLKDFFELLLPEVYKKINWKEGYVSLDKELQKISRNSVIGKKITDGLFKVCSIDEEEMYVMCLIEIQGNKNNEFLERVFVYHGRIYSHYRKPILVIVVLLDNDTHWRPTQFKTGIWGYDLEMNFASIKLLDYQTPTQIEWLKASTNRFAPIILAQLAAKQRVSDEIKLVNKVNLTKHLYKLGWSKEDILEIYLFIDWIMVLPESLELEYHNEIEQFEESNKMSYISTAERIGIKKGIEIGFEQGVEQERETLRTLFLSLLNQKFATVPEAYLLKIEASEHDDILKWIKKLFKVKAIEELFIE